MDDLIIEIQRELKKRKGEWRRIAAMLPGISYSWISQIGRGKYSSEPSYTRLQRIYKFLKNHKGRRLADQSQKKAI